MKFAHAAARDSHHCHSLHKNDLSVSQSMISIPWKSNCDDPSFCPFGGLLYFRHCIILFYLMFTFSMYHYPFCNVSKSCLIYLSPGFLNDCLVHPCQVEGVEKVKAMTAFRAVPVNAKLPTQLSTTTGSSTKYSQSVMEAVLE